MEIDLLSLIFGGGMALVGQAAMACVLTSDSNIAKRICKYLPRI